MALFSYKIQYPNTYPSYNSTIEKIEWVGVGFTVRPYNNQHHQKSPKTLMSSRVDMVSKEL
jgi:hypothetical protein